MKLSMHVNHSLKFATHKIQNILNCFSIFLVFTTGAFELELRKVLSQVWSQYIYLLAPRPIISNILATPVASDKLDSLDLDNTSHGMSEMTIEKHMSD